MFVCFFTVLIIWGVSDVSSSFSPFLQLLSLLVVLDSVVVQVISLPFRVTVVALSFLLVVLYLGFLFVFVCFSSSEFAHYK